MPKIDVNEKMFFKLLGEKLDYKTLEERLTCGKAELDEAPDMNVSENERVIKIELNDTNRPDLWSTAGVARQLRLHRGGKRADYSSFLSTEAKKLDTANRQVTVDENLKDIRPFMTAFVISGKPIDEPMLLDIIQTQEKLCWNFGRKRKSVSMGVYRSSQVKWPIHYKAVDPDKTSFIPLQCEEAMTCRQILTEHPKGKEYGHIIADFSMFPLLQDDAGETMSMAPIINSASLGAVQVGDSDLLVEMTGTDMASLLLSTNIVACDFFDAGYEILPVTVHHPYETGFGKDITSPFYFQTTTSTALSEVNKLLGSDLSLETIVDALSRMDNDVSTSIEGDSIKITVAPPAYRNDFLHGVDVIEDVLIGCGISSFKPESPKDFTIGRLSPVTLASRKAKMLLGGLGYQEMIFNYLGSKKDYIERMCIAGDDVIEISNPMTENYQFVRPSILPSLLNAEAVSANAVYPHRIYEIGKVAYLCDEENTGCRTRQHVGFMTASGDTNYNELASQVSALLYFLNQKYVVQEASDPRFIAGRQAEILVDGKVIGIFGEVHPQVLENWAISVPCSACEFDIEELLTNE